MKRYLLLFIALLCPATCASAETVLVRDGKPLAAIAVKADAPKPVRFAAEELQRYVREISGATLPIAEEAPGSGVTIRLGSEPGKDPWDDGFRIEVTDRQIQLRGNTPRATLFAAYTLLERLGCRWFAPKFAFYPAGSHETVPKATALTLKAETITERPAMRYRAKYVEEGRTHTPANLPALVDWMAKTRQNVLSCPMDYGGSGRVRWDNFRAALTPELQKRGLLIEVGGHGYQNFLPAERYFAEHPEWFGMDEQGKRTRAKERVFETNNPSALAEFTKNVLAYLRDHPEIDIFDLWPPDGAKWSEDPAAKALGEPSVRHALVVNQIARAVAKEFPRVTVEFIAYQNYLTPPPGVEFAPNTLVGFCPISQSFTTGIDDPRNETNKKYWDALAQWLARKDLAGRVYVYSYYRKYAWRSLPVLLPRTIGHDLAAYRKAGVIGLSSYSEPGDWLTYEVQHLALARATWTPDEVPELFLPYYCLDRFGRNAAVGMPAFFEVLENTVPQGAAIPGTPAPSAEQMAQFLQALEDAKALQQQALQLVAGDPARKILIERLGVSLEYARLELWQRGHPERREAAAKALAALVDANRDTGIFVSPDTVRTRFDPPKATSKR